MVKILKNILIFFIFVSTAQVHSNEFPEGTFHLENFTLESGSQKIDGKNMYSLNGSITTEVISKTSIGTKVNISIKVNKNSQLRSDTRYDEFFITWDTTSSGKLKNKNKKYSNDITYFNIKNNKLILTTKVERHNFAKETQIYKLIYY